ncbi:hypothetical protein ACO2Q3_10170 [Caulobacter sp. KR2-114]|uniref:hypothetical protein n=1 Tax=Caulobacter sp. KR2-114 TaxID=3400912 RepID=UPI003C03B54E
MRGLGYFLIVVGLALGAWGFMFDISVQGDANLIDRISNLSLVSERELILAGAVAAIASGSAFIAAAEAADVVLEGIAKYIIQASVRAQAAAAASQGADPDKPAGE